MLSRGSFLMDTFEHRARRNCRTTARYQKDIKLREITVRIRSTQHGGLIPRNSRFPLILSWLRRSDWANRAQKTTHCGLKAQIALHISRPVFIFLEGRNKNKWAPNFRSLWQESRYDNFLAQTSWYAIHQTTQHTPVKRTSQASLPSQSVYSLFS